MERLSSEAGGSSVRKHKTYSGTPEVALLAGLFFILGLGDSGPLDLRTMNMLGPAGLVAILGYGIWRLLRADLINIWAPLLWFRIACTGYYGIGALIPYVANDVTQAYLRELYFFSDEEVLKSNAINVLGILIVLVTSLILRTAPRPRNKVLLQRERPSTFVKITTIFLISGAIARYGIVVPFLLGLWEGVLPSIVSMLAKGYSAGLMMLIILALRRGGLLLILAAALVLIEIGVGVILFNKSDVLITILVITLAVYQHKPSLARLALSGVLTFMIFTTLVPIASFGRDETIKIGGRGQVATIEDRLEIVNRYVQGERPVENDSDVQSGLARLSYVNVGTFVIAMYDAGIPINSLGNAFAALVPRFVWPNKPFITASGEELYRSATGNEGTSISAGLFAEAYANLGWWGLAILMTVLGVVLAVLTRISIGSMREPRWIFLPIVLLSIQIGTRVDGSFVSDVVGAPFTVLIFYVLLRLAESVPGLNRRV